MKGIMPTPKRGAKYTIEGVEEDAGKWGIQYKIKSIFEDVNIDDTEGQRKYLESLFTERQVESMYSSIPNPFKAFEDNDVSELLKIKGCGFKTASQWLAKFKKEMSKARIFIDLAEFDLTPSMMNSLLEKYTSPQMAVEAVKRNPYVLIDLPGIGWKKCDAAAQRSGIAPYSSARVEAYIKYYLKEAANSGYTYVYANTQLMPSILEVFGEEIPDEPISIAIRNLGKRLWWSEDRERVGLMRYVWLEQKIAKKLIELRDAKGNFHYENWREIIREKEKAQGWEYSEQQIKGIQAALENQVVIITGYGGTGKSSIVAGVVEVLKNYRYAQCALSGRAAARLAEVTHTEGFTIHRLLNYPQGPSEKGKFYYNDETSLPYQVVIVDEISMVDGELFYALIRALKPGTKLILLGDVGQLESIGCSNVANDIIESPEIVSVTLDKIHRQAEASAIITDSIKARHGEQVIEKDFAGTVTRGALQDLTYECYSDANNTFYKIMKEISELISDGISLHDIQVIVPMKDRGGACTWELNNAIQGMYNPLPEGGKQLVVHYSKDRVGYLRAGDKVINVQNNYKAVLYSGQWKEYEDLEEDVRAEQCPVFNGNMGVIEAINTERSEAIINFIGIGRILVKKNDLKTMMLGYAVTVHKCQGSEFPYVIVGIDYSSYALLSRQLVYTAITRAKKHCWVKAQTKALRYAISNNSVSVKQTLLQEALYEAGHPKYEF